jgi:hypothetical protein
MVFVPIDCTAAQQVWCRLIDTIERALGKKASIQANKRWMINLMALLCLFFVVLILIIRYTSTCIICYAHWNLAWEALRSADDLFVLFQRTFACLCWIGWSYMLLVIESTKRALSTCQSAMMSTQPHNSARESRRWWSSILKAFFVYEHQ